MVSRLETAVSAVIPSSAREVWVISLSLSTCKKPQDVSVVNAAFLCAFSHGYHVTAEKWHLCCMKTFLQLVCLGTPSLLYWILHLQLELPVGFLMAAARWAAAQHTGLCSVPQYSLWKSRPQPCHAGLLISFTNSSIGVGDDDGRVLVSGFCEPGNNLCETNELVTSDLPWLVCGTCKCSSGPVVAANQGRKRSEGKKWEWWGLPVVSAHFSVGVKQVRNS